MIKGIFSQHFCDLVYNCVFPQLIITRDGCGISVLCLASPEGCDPAGNDNCTFVSFKLIGSGQQRSVIFRMRGETVHFLSVGLTPDPSQVRQISSVLFGWHYK